MLSSVATRSSRSVVLNRFVVQSKANSHATVKNTVIRRRDFFSRGGGKEATTKTTVDPWLQPLKQVQLSVTSTATGTATTLRGATRRTFAEGSTKSRRSSSSGSTTGSSSSSSSSWIAQKAPWLEPIGNTAKNYWKELLGGIVIGTGVLQSLYGKENDFYDRRFVLDCDPDLLADFYGSENFMDLYSVLPIMGALMMRGGYFDDEGTVHTQGLPFGEMLVSMVFSDSDDDENGSGDDDAKWFNKRERFKNECLDGKFIMWDMITNFGFESLPDGRVMVYHHGEYFYGYLPPVSLVVGLIFRIHSWFVIKTTEHHLRYYAFKNDTDVDEKMEHESRDAMPIFWLKNYNPLKVIGYLLLDKPLDMPAHLKEKRNVAMVQYKLDNPDEDEDEEEVEEEDTEEVEDEEEIAVKLARKKTLADTMLSKSHTLPVQRAEVMRQISMDIAMDKAHAKETLGGGGSDDRVQTKEEDEEEEAISSMIKGNHSNDNPIHMQQKLKTRLTKLRRIKTSVALKKFKTSLDRQTEIKANENSSSVHPSVEAHDESEPALMKKRQTMKRYATKIHQDLSKAVEAHESVINNTISSSDDDSNVQKKQEEDGEDIDNFRAVGMTARARLVARRATKARINEQKRRGTSLIGRPVKLSPEEAELFGMK